MKSACGCEIASLFVFTEYLNNKNYDAVVFDTVPTGHMLEDLTNQINYTLNLTKQIKAQQKLKSVFNKSEFEKRMKGLKEYEIQQKNAIKNLQSNRTFFLMTILPEGLLIFEAERSTKVLESVYKIPVRGIIINEVLPESERYSTPFWQNRWNMQNKYIKQAYQKFKGKLIAQVPLLDGEVIGLEKIRKIGEALYG